MQKVGSAFALWSLVIANFVSAVGFGAILPILTLFVTHRGFPLAWLGLLTAASMGTSFVLQMPLGRLSDRAGRRPVMISGLLAVAAGTLGFLMSWPPLFYLVSRAMQGAGNAAVGPAAAAMVTDIAAPSERARAFGLLSSGTMAGFVLGPMIGGLAAGIGGYDWTFAAGAILSVMAALLILFVPSTRSVQEVRKNPRHQVIGSLWPLLALNFGWYGLIGMYDTVWSIYLRQMGASVSLIGIAFAVFGLPIVLLAVPGGRMADRSGRYERLVVIGAMLNAVIVVGYALVHSLWLAIGNSLLESFVIGWFSPAFQAAIARHAPAGEFGAAQGAAGAAGTLGAFVSALIAGTLLGWNLRAPFVMGAILTFTCAIVAALGMRSLPQMAAARHGDGASQAPNVADMPLPPSP